MKLVQTKAKANEWAPVAGIILAEELKLIQRIKEDRLAVTSRVPDYKESCTSVFTEEPRLTGHFCPSISGGVTTPPADSRETARIEAVYVMSRCCSRLREVLLPPDDCLVWAGEGSTVSVLRHSNLRYSLLPSRSGGDQSLSLHPSAAHFSPVCCAQYSVVSVTATPNDDLLPKSSVVNFLLPT